MRRGVRPAVLLRAGGSRRSSTEPHKTVIPDPSLYGRMSGGPSWILYVDMDAFYVNCELRRHPQLRGLPVIVGRRPVPRVPTRAVVLSASYEARAFGVRSAQPVGQAARRCPQAEWLAPDFELYDNASREVRDWLIARFGSAFPQSIDEAWVSVSCSDLAECTQVAREAQRALSRSLSLPSSWGVAQNRLVAKIASDRAKPGGVVGVETGRLAEFLAPLSVRVIPGVGPKTGEILRGVGIERVGELASRPPAEIRRLLGSWGTSLVAIARGHPPPEPELATGLRSRSVDRTFDADLADPARIEAETVELAHRLAGALQQEGLVYRGVGVAVRWGDFRRVQRSRSLTGATGGAETLVEQSLRLLRELLRAEGYGRNRPVRTLTVRAERVSSPGAKQSLLEEFEPASFR